MTVRFINQNKWIYLSYERRHQRYLFSFNNNIESSENVVLCWIHLLNNITPTLQRQNCYKKKYLNAIIIFDKNNKDYSYISSFIISHWCLCHKLKSCSVKLHKWSINWFKNNNSTSKLCKFICVLWYYKNVENFNNKENYHLLWQL